MQRGTPAALAVALPALAGRRVAASLWQWRQPRCRQHGGVAAAAPRRRRLLSTQAADSVPENVHVKGAEFHFTPYYDVPDLEFGRDNKFCLLALRHPKLDAADDQGRHQFYGQKRLDRASRVMSVFQKCDEDQAGSLDANQLKKALNKIGMPTTEDWVHGLYQRHNKNNDGRMLRKEFEHVVDEAWGRVPDPHFHDQLAKVHPELVGIHGYSFIGRDSPANWVLRMVRNLWPFAIKQAAIMRNRYENPRYELHLMEALIDTYEGQKVRGITTAMDLVASAENKQPTDKDGLVIRIVPTFLGARQWPEGGASTLIPMRCYSENNPGMIGKVGGWLKSWR